ncbi:hypothetical protein BASA81_006680 [Batrachochytrium salamandrivorans]|nr:hypothetical protein BASA81_006680 [Batrachochytrium salamandrivorans]
MMLPLDVRDVFLGYALLDAGGHDLMVRACQAVAPIMRKRGWKVGKVEEFSPPNPTLLGLNINRGQKIQIRLRNAHQQYLDFESILHTLLHELVHIVVSNHSAQFYEMLQALVKEAELVVFRHEHNVSDLHGRFWGQGQRLGEGSVSTLSNGGNRLGGSKMFGMSAKAATRQATLQRMQTCKGGGCGTIVIDEDDDIVVFVPPPSKIHVIDLEEDKSNWTCLQCTYDNDGEHLQCLICWEIKA